MKSLLATLAVAVSLTLTSGCVEKADKALCDRATETMKQIAIDEALEAAGGDASPALRKMVTEQAGKAAKQQFADFMTACLDGAPKSTVECIIAAKNRQDMAACQ